LRPSRRRSATSSGRRRWGAIATGARRAHPDADTVNQSARLAEVFRAKGLPVVLVNVVGGASAHRGRPVGRGS
jgi:hypothetical protein